MKEGISMTSFPEIIDNRSVLLKDVIRQILPNSNKVDIAAGYFYLSGFDLIKDVLKEEVTMRIIIGQETNKQTAIELSNGYKMKQNILDELKKDLDELNSSETISICTLRDLIRDNKVHVKIYTKDKFHSKAYIFDTGSAINSKIAIIGSSNFTRRGLGVQGNEYNTELNATLFQPSMVEKVEKWYQEIWEEADDFSEELLNILDNKIKNILYMDYSPSTVYEKILYEYIGREYLADLDMEHDIRLTEFQEVAVKRGYKILNKYGGVIIADAVGLGKTFIAKGIIEQIQSIGKKILIICPASLKILWEQETNELNVKKEIISQESVGREGLANVDMDNFDYVFIDEAHSFRNITTNRYTSLIKEIVGKKVVLLTATPINNSVYDLYNLLSLFLKDDVFKKSFGIASLKNVFKDFANKQNDVSKILSETMIRRSKKYVQMYYSQNDKSGFNIKFPTRILDTINYKLGDIYNGNIFEQIGNLIENINLPILSEYETTEIQEIYNKALVKTLLLKRFESSIEAFKISIRKQLKYCDLMLESIKNGKVFYKRDIAGFNEENLEYELIKPIQKDINNVNFDREEFVRYLNDDRISFELILNLLVNTDETNDNKLKALNGLLTENPNRKILIFSQYKDTTRYLHRALQNLGYKDIEEIDSNNSNEQRKVQIVSQFSPKSNKENYNNRLREIKILIATDILAEGQNLQDADTIINYDLPWNPVRIIQRQGRIDRLNSEHDYIYVYNFIPDDKLDEILKLTKKLYDKIEYINLTVGTENKIVFEDENDNDIIFDGDAIKRLSENDESVLIEIEEGQEQYYPDEEIFYTEFKKYFEENSLSREQFEILPLEIESYVENTSQNGVLIYLKNHSRNYISYYNSDSGEFIEDKNIIYDLLQLAKTRKEKPIFNEMKINSFKEQIIKYKLKKESDIKLINQVNNIASKITDYQRTLSIRLESILSKANRNQLITDELRYIRTRMKSPLHRGMILKLKAISLEKENDEIFVKKLYEILLANELNDNEKSFESELNIVGVLYF